MESGHGYKTFGWQSLHAAFLWQVLGCPWIQDDSELWFFQFAKHRNSLHLLMEIPVRMVRGDWWLVRQVTSQYHKMINRLKYSIHSLWLISIHCKYWVTNHSKGPRFNPPYDYQSMTMFGSLLYCSAPILLSIPCLSFEQIQYGGGNTFYKTIIHSTCFFMIKIVEAWKGMKNFFLKLIRDVFKKRNTGHCLKRWKGVPTGSQICQNFQLEQRRQEGGGPNGVQMQQIEYCLQGVF